MELMLYNNPMSQEEKKKKNDYLSFVVFWDMCVYVCVCLYIAQPVLKRITTTEFVNVKYYDTYVPIIFFRLSTEND
jgi:hypothetical protein